MTTTNPSDDVRSCSIKVPATSANLGPGFDVFAAALSPQLELEVVRAERFAVQTELAIARNRRNLCVRAFARSLDPDGFEFRIRSDIPLAGGLGSSAAASVAGLLAARAFTSEKRDDVVAVASKIEGHPDNATAAVLGGFVICSAERSVHLSPPEGLSAVIVVPGEAVRTRQARAVLPRNVTLRDASFNIGRASLLALGLERGDLDLVAHGLADRLHQTQRAPLFPRSAQLIGKAAKLGALGATISGAGPSVLFWTKANDQMALLERVRAACAGWATAEPVAFESRGARVRVHKA